WRPGSQRATDRRAAREPWCRQGVLLSHLIHRLPLGPRDVAFLAATFLTVDFLADDFLAVLAVDLLAVDCLGLLVLADAFLAVDFLAGALAADFFGLVPSDLVLFPSRGGSILAAPAPGANKLS